MISNFLLVSANANAADKSIISGTTGRGISTPLIVAAGTYKGLHTRQAKQNRSRHSSDNTISNNRADRKKYQQQRTDNESGRSYATNKNSGLRQSGKSRDHHSKSTASSYQDRSDRKKYQQQNIDNESGRSYTTNKNFGQLQSENSRDRRGKSNASSYQDGSGNIKIQKPHKQNTITYTENGAGKSTDLHQTGKIKDDRFQKQITINKYKNHHDNDHDKHHKYHKHSRKHKKHTVHKYPVRSVFFLGYSYLPYSYYGYSHRYYSGDYNYAVPAYYNSPGNSYGGSGYTTESVYGRDSIAWSLLSDGQFQAALNRFAKDIDYYPHAGIPKVGYALAAAAIGDLTKSVLAMREALRNDPDSLQYINPDERLLAIIDDLIEKYEQPLLQYDNKQPDEAFMVSVLHYLRQDYLLAHNALGRAIADGDRSQSLANLHTLVYKKLQDNYAGDYN